ncbi:MAG: peptidylprolyl isomerase [Pirellulaceae bacterium]|nr:peptidylprolyl isomerase [Pirellulaceae bacterium]
MAGQDVLMSTNRASFWTPRKRFAIVAALTISTCIAIRWLDGAQQSDGAQKQSTLMAQASSTKTKANVVAVINGKPFSHNDLARECLKRHGTEVLENLVNKAILLQECERLKVRITREEVEQEIDSMATKFGLPKARWLEMLQQERGITSLQYRADIIWPTLALRRLGVETMVISDEALQQSYESHYGPKVHVRMISVSQQEKAQRIHDQLRENPELFARLAMDESEDSNSAAYGGVVPPIRRHMGNPELESVAFALKPGEISQLLFVANQFIILKCEKHLEAIEVSRQDLPVITARLEEKIRREKERSVATDTFERLQKEAQPQIFFNDPKLRKEHPGVAAIVGGQPIKVNQLANACVQRHGTEILDIEINRRLLQQELRQHKLVINQSDIDTEIRRAARAFGITTPDGSADIERWLTMVIEEEEVTKPIYISDVVWPTVALKKLVSHKVTVSEEDLKKGFQANYGERVECLAIVLTDQRLATQVHQKAKKTDSTENFGHLASVYSIEPVSRNNHGRIPPIARYSGQPHVEKIAFSLQSGEISPVIASRDRFIILRCVGRTKPITKQLTAVRELLYEDLLEKKIRIEMAQHFDLVREKAQIDNYLAKTSQSGREQPSRRATAATKRQQPTARTLPNAGPVAPASATVPVNNVQRR